MTRIGKYEVLEQVGEGAMGVVYRAADPVLNRQVAIKVMSEGMAQDEALRQRFLREAQAAGSLQHPNVVTIYDFGETDGHLFIAMEYIEGTDLEQLLLKGTAIPLPEKIEIIIDVLNGLSYAHRRGIVHRDIKPANIRIDNEGHARIMDFGVAHLATSNLTSTGVMMGTPNYMAPEQITDGEIGPATDLFSVGAVLYELLTSAKPFQADTLHRVLFRIVSEPPPDLNATAPDLPMGLSRVVKKALAKDVKERYQTATEMANDLAAVRAALGAPRASRTVSQRSSIERSLMARKTVQMSDVNRWKMISGVAAGLLIVGIGGGSALFFANRPAPPAAQEPPASPVTVAGAPVTRPDSIAPPSTTPAPPVAPPASTASRTAAPNTGTATQREPRQVPPPTETRAKSAAPPRDVAAKTTPTQPASPPPAARDTERAASSALAPSLSAPAQVQASSPQPDGASQPASPPAATPPVTQQTATPQSATQQTVTQAPPPAAPPVPENPRPAITAVIASYARAIGTMDVAEVRRVYAGMTPQQAAAWSSFFSSVRSMTANLEIASLETGSSSAVARVTGAYEFVTRAGRADRQPASFEAVFQRDGDRWRLQAIR